MHKNLIIENKTDERTSSKYITNLDYIVYILHYIEISIKKYRLMKYLFNDCYIYIYIKILFLKERSDDENENACYKRTKKPSIFIIFS